MLFLMVTIGDPDDSAEGDGKTQPDSEGEGQLDTQSVDDNDNNDPGSISISKHALCRFCSSPSNEPCVFFTFD